MFCEFRDTAPAGAAISASVLVRTPVSKSLIFVCANEGISSLTNALNVGAAALPEAAPANT